MSLTYPIKLEPDDNGTLLVTCPALPEVTTFGEDEADAIEHARDAIEEAIAARMADGREVPEPKGKQQGFGRLAYANIAKSRALPTSHARECHPS